MTNRLYKEDAQQLVSPAIPGSPATSRLVQTGTAAGFYPLAQYLANPTNINPDLIVPNGSLIGLSATVQDALVAAYYAGNPVVPGVPWVFAFAPQYQLVYFGATQPVPAVYSVLAPPGWNASARSIDEFFNNGQVTFQVQAGGQYAAGLTSVASDPTNPARIEFGFRISGSKANVVESGVIGPLVTSAVTGATVFKVKHVRRAITYYIDGTLVYTSAIVDAVPRMFWLQACLYQPSSYIDAPTIMALGVAELVLPSLQAIGGQGTQQSGANLMLPALQVQSRRSSGAALTLPPLQATGGRAYASAQLTLPALQAEGHPGLSVGNGAYLFLPPLVGGGTGLTGTVGGANLVLPALLAGGGRPLGGANITLPALAAQGGDSPGVASMSSTRFLEDAWATEMLLTVTMDSSGTVTSVMAVSIAIDATMNTSGTGSDAWSSSAILTAVMDSILTGASFIPLGDQPGTTWVVNLDGNATSTYENFAFNSFGRVGDSYLAVRADGVYLLEGDTDDGAPISASVSYGKQNFGTNAKKRLTAAYVGLSSSGTMYLKVRINDQDEYIYAARRDDAHQRMQRFDVGKGIEATYLTFELFNADGADFELASVEFQAVEMTRRI